MPSSSASRRATRAACSALAPRSVARPPATRAELSASTAAASLVRGGQASAVVLPAGRHSRSLFVFLLGEPGAGPGLLDGVRQAGPSSSLAATRLRAAPTCPRSRASWSARAAAARAWSASRRSAAARSASAALRPDGLPSAARAVSSRSPRTASCSRIEAASASSSPGPGRAGPGPGRRLAGSAARGRGWPPRAAVRRARRARTRC